MTDRHGWYIASTNTEHGDKEFSREARLLWERTWAAEKTVRDIHEEEASLGPRDGVSIFEQQGEVVHCLIRGERRTILEPLVMTAWQRLMEDDE
jgi:hypothetical protein